jgi:hypothetical protein
MPCCASLSKIIIGAINVVIIVGAIIAGVLVYEHRNEYDWTEFKSAEIPAILTLAVALFAVLSAIIGLISLSGLKCARVLYLIIVVLAILFEAALVVIAFLYKDTILDDIDKHWNDSGYTKTRTKLEKDLSCCGFETDESLSICGYAPPVGQTPDHCKDKIAEQVKKYQGNIQIAAIVLVVAELLLVIAAIYLTCHKEHPAYQKGITPF